VSHCLMRHPETAQGVDPPRHSAHNFNSLNRKEASRPNRTRPIEGLSMVHGGRTDLEAFCSKSRHDRRTRNGTWPPWENARRPARTLQKRPVLSSFRSGPPLRDSPGRRIGGYAERVLCRASHGIRDSPHPPSRDAAGSHHSRPPDRRPGRHERGPRPAGGSLLLLLLR
jgi:hypothetical protein